MGKISAKSSSKNIRAAVKSSRFFTAKEASIKAVEKQGDVDVVLTKKR